MRINKIVLSVIFMWCFSLEAHPINMDAIAEIESSNNPLAFNKSSGARGLYQITPIVLNQFNEDKRATERLMRFASSDASAVVWKHPDFRNTHKFTPRDLFNSEINRIVSDYYFDWIFNRVGNEIDTLICYNWGYGNYKKWKISGMNYKKLPKETRNYLKKYTELTQIEQ